MNSVTRLVHLKFSNWNIINRRKTSQVVSKGQKPMDRQHKWAKSKKPSQQSLAGAVPDSPNGMRSENVHS